MRSAGGRNHSGGNNVPAKSSDANATLNDDGTTYHGVSTAGVLTHFNYYVDFVPSHNSDLTIQIRNLNSSPGAVFYLLVRYGANPDLSTFDYIAVGGYGVISVSIPGSQLHAGPWNIAVLDSRSRSYELSVTYNGQRDFWMKPCMLGSNYHSRVVSGHSVSSFSGRRANFSWSAPTRVLTPGNVHTSITFKSDLFPRNPTRKGVSGATLAFTIDLYERSYEVWNGDELVQISDGDVKYSVASTMIFALCFVN